MISGTRLPSLPHLLRPAALGSFWWVLSGAAAWLAWSMPPAATFRAQQIARDWNVKHSGAGYITPFKILRSFLGSHEA